LKKVQLVISNWKIFVGGLKQSKHMFTFLIPNTSKTKGENGKILCFFSLALEPCEQFGLPESLAFGPLCRVPL